jgi:hypothetical protein
LWEEAFSTMDEDVEASARGERVCVKKCDVLVKFSGRGVEKSRDEEAAGSMLVFCGKLASLEVLHRGSRVAVWYGGRCRDSLSAERPS